MATRKPVVLVTGASKGIGLAVTRLLLRKLGAQVIALSRTRTKELAELASADLLTIACDVADDALLREAVHRGQAYFGGLDGLVLNAGVLDPLCRIGDQTPISAWKQHFDVNFFSLISALGAALPSLRASDHGGRVVFVSSGAAIKGTAGWGPYNASKAAMNSLCRTFAEEEPGIVSVAIRPGMVDTGMQCELRSKGASAMTPEDHAKFVRVHAEGSLVRPEHCGHVIAALSIRAPKELSGQFLSWDSEACKEYRNT